MAEGKLTREQARFYRERWRAIEDLERRELRAKTAADRWVEFADILEFARMMRLTAPEEDTAAVNDRWRRLKELHGRRARP